VQKLRKFNNEKNFVKEEKSVINPNPNLNLNL